MYIENLFAELQTNFVSILVRVSSLFDYPWYTVACQVSLSNNISFSTLHGSYDLHCDHAVL